MSKKNGKALAVRTPKQSPMQAIWDKALSALTVPKPRIDKDYQVGLVNRKHVLWMQFTDKATGQKKFQPYVMHRGLMDVLTQRGYKEMSCEGLPARPCMEAGCYGALDIRKGDKTTDYQQVSRATIVLKSGLKVVMEGDACRHNTSKMISGAGQARGNAMKRMAETRSIDRAVSRAVNISACAVVELPDLDAAATWKKGDQIMTKAEVETILEGEILEASSSPAKPSGPEAPQPAPAQAATEPVSHKADDEWERGSKAMHARATEMKMTTEELHAHIYEVATKAYDRHICTMKDLTGPELWEIVKYLRRLTPANVETIKKWFQAEGKNILDAARATVAERGKK